MKRLNEDYIYLDYAATSPLCEEAAEAMQPLLLPGRDNILTGANPNSLSTPGRLAFEELEKARKETARFLEASRPDEIVFTSGATEADNAAIIGLSLAMLNKKSLAGHAIDKPHVITTTIEHDAVLAPAKQLEHNGFEVTYLSPDRNGFISPELLKDAICERTLLVSVQMANSEIGAIQDIESLANISHENGVLMHTDAVQALGKVPINLSSLGVDAASFSSHKIGGPKGFGALYIKNRTPFSPQILGGGQESGRRSGTQNVVGAKGFAAALKAAQENVLGEQIRLCGLRDKVYQAISSNPNIRASVDVNIGSLDYLPNIVNILAPGIESETLVLRFDALGIAVSGGSACSSHSLDPSHVLVSLGIAPDDALCALRVSMGRYTTDADIDAFLRKLDEVINWR